jgi:putative hydrolase of the HAD superfamily
LKKRIATVIFDFGGVLSLPQDPGHLRAMEEISRLTHERFMPLYRRDRLELDRGTLSADDYWRRILEEGGVAPTPELVAAIEREDSGGWTQMNPRVMAWTRELRKAGVRTAILSNMPSAKLAFMRDGTRFAWLGDFAATVWSCDYLLVKPEAAFYRVCLERLGDPPEACLFLDDVQVNVEGARAVGINAELFRSATETAPLIGTAWGLPVQSLVEDAR